MSILRAIAAGPWVERAGLTLFHSLWQLAAVGLLFALVTTACRRRSPQFRYLAAVAALLLSASLPLATWLVLPAWNSTVDVPEGDKTNTALQSKTAAETSTRFTLAPANSLEGEMFNSAESPQLPDKPNLLTSDLPDDGKEHTAEIASRPPTESVRQPRALSLIQPWLGRMVALWGVGVFVLSLWHVGGWLLIRHVRRRGREVTTPRIVEILHELQRRLKLSRTIRLIETSLVRSPAMCGWLKPVVLLPVGLTAGIPLEQLEALLAHELAHIRRHDLLVNVLQAVLETLLFYHPAIWWISHRVRIEREFCTDEAAAVVCGNRFAYARALAALEERRTLQPGLALAANDGHLKQRIESVLGIPGGAAPARTAGSAGLFALLLVASLMLIWMADSMKASVQAPAPKAAGPIDDRSQPDSSRKSKVSQSPFDALQRSQLSPELLEMLDIDHPPGELVALLGRLPQAHWNFLTCYAFSPDGKLLATGGADHVVKLWNRAEQEQIERIDVPGDLHSLAFSPDSDVLAIGYDDFTSGRNTDQGVILWNLITERTSRRFVDRETNHATFSHDGQRVAGGSEGRVKVWDAATGREMLSIDAHVGNQGQRFPAQHVEFSWDDQKLLTFGSVLPGQAGGPLLVSAVQLWDSHTGERLQQWRNVDASSRAARFSPDSTLIALGCSDGSVKVWSVAEQKVLRTMRGHDEGVEDVTFSPDGKSLATVASFDSIRVWDVATGRQKHLIASPSVRYHSVQFTPDGNSLTVMSQRQIYAWDAKTMKPVDPLLPLAKAFWSANVDPGGRTVATGDGKGGVALWDVATLKTRKEWQAHQSHITRLAFNPDGSRLLTSGSGKSAAIWDASSGKKKFEFATSDKHNQWWLRFSNDEQSVVSSDSTGKVRFWNSRTGVLEKTFVGDGVYSRTTFDAEMRLLAISSHERMRIYHLDTGIEKSWKWNSVQSSSVRAISVSPDGKRIATAAKVGLLPERGKQSKLNGVITLWDSSSGRLERVLRGHTSHVVGCVAFSPDGKTVGSAANDGTVRLWDPVTGEMQRTIKIGPAGGRLESLVFCKDGRHLITLNGNGTVAVLRLAEANAGRLSE